MKLCKVSVIVPIYNAEKHLYKCIKSIVNQTYKNMEVILVNDGSTDNSLKICNDYKKKDKRIKVINKKNGGVSSARNRGIEEATGKYIMFIDSDDYIDKNCILSLINNSTSSSELVGINYKYWFEEKCEYISSYSTFKRIDNLTVSILKGKVMGTVWMYIFDKNKIGNIRFDENISFLEDTLFLTCYLKKIKTIKFITKDDSYYNYCYSINSITKSCNKVYKNIDNFLTALDKIDEETNFKFSKYIRKIKNILIEKECSKLNNINDFKIILNNDKIRKNVSGISLFSIIYKFNNPKLLKVYYRIRKKTKEVYRKLRKIQIL